MFHLYRIIIVSTEEQEGSQGRAALSTHKRTPTLPIASLTLEGEGDNRGGNSYSKHTYAISYFRLNIDAVKGVRAAAPYLMNADGKYIRQNITSDSGNAQTYKKEQ